MRITKTGLQSLITMKPSDFLINLLQNYVFLSSIFILKKAKEMIMTGKTAVEFLLQLEHEVRKDIYDYLTLDDLNYDNENLE